MGRSPCCSKENMNKGAWTAFEDKILTDYINLFGVGHWRNLPQKAGLKRCGKSCRLRWLNYLRPGIKRGNISPDEEDLIIRLHKLLGNRWTLIAGRLPGRTDNEIKNYWNTSLSKKVQQLNWQKPCTITKMPIDISTPLPSTLFRAKAVKCTKVIPSHVVGSTGPRDFDNNANKNLDKVSTMRDSTEKCEGSLDISHRPDPAVGTSSGRANQVNIVETPPESFIADLDLDLVFLSDLLMNSEFPLDEYNSTYCSNISYFNRDNDMLKEREKNMGLEFNCFASSVFDGASEEDWLAEDLE